MRAARSRAFSSIDALKSMPVTDAFSRIQRQVDAGADADLEHALARLDVHALDRLQTAGVQRRTEDEVVDLRELVVDAFDESFSTAVTESARVAASPVHSSGVGFSIE